MVDKIWEHALVRQSKRDRKKLANWKAKMYRGHTGTCARFHLHPRSVRTVTIHRDLPHKNALLTNNHLFPFTFFARGYFHYIHSFLKAFGIDS